MNKRITGKDKNYYCCHDLALRLLKLSRRFLLGTAIKPALYNDGGEFIPLHHQEVKKISKISKNLYLQIEILEQHIYQYYQVQ